MRLGVGDTSTGEQDHIPNDYHVSSFFYVPIYPPLDESGGYIFPAYATHRTAAGNPGRNSSTNTLGKMDVSTPHRLPTYPVIIQHLLTHPPFKVHYPETDIHPVSLTVQIRPWPISECLRFLSQSTSLLCRHPEKIDEKLVRFGPALNFIKARP